MEAFDCTGETWTEGADWIRLLLKVMQLGFSENS